MKLLALVTLILLTAAAPALASTCKASLPRKGEVFSGVVVRIVAGDSLCVGEEDGGIKVRLADFNATDKGQPYSQTAKETLYELVSGRKITCVAQRKSLERIVAVCTMGGRSLGDLMRERGIPEGGKL
jgi:endonuclease YncB( thermonuclease family)